MTSWRSTPPPAACSGFTATRTRQMIACCGSNNRGVAVLGERVYMGTLDGHLDRDRRPGRAAGLEDARRRQQTGLFDYRLAAGAEGSRHRRRWRRGVRHPRIHLGVSRADREGGVAFYTIPGPGEPGHETWEACPPDSKTYCDPEAWKHGGSRRCGSPDPTILS